MNNYPDERNALVVFIDSANWIQHLGLVMLGLRTAVKYDLNCSTTEILY